MSQETHGQTGQSLTSHFGELRELRNPEARYEIPAGFPPVTVAEPATVLPMLEQQLDKRGLSLATVGRIRNRRR